MKRRKQWPEGWEWELELTPHLEKRMADRGFDELDLSRMLTRASGFRPDFVLGRWVIKTRHKREPWELIVEPDEAERRLAVVTGYRLEKKL